MLNNRSVYVSFWVIPPRDDLESTCSSERTRLRPMARLLDQWDAWLPRGIPLTSCGILWRQVYETHWKSQEASPKADIRWYWWDMIRSNKNISSISHQYHSIYLAMIYLQYKFFIYLARSAGLLPCAIRFQVSSSLASMGAGGQQLGPKNARSILELSRTQEIHTGNLSVSCIFHHFASIFSWRPNQVLSPHICEPLACAACGSPRRDPLSCRDCRRDPAGGAPSHEQHD
jgi:hypothetical protein